MFSALEKLNLDVVFTIKTFLGFEDTARLSLTCKQFHEWLHEEAVCRYTVQVRSPLLLVFYQLWKSGNIVVQTKEAALDNSFELTLTYVEHLTF